MQPRETPLPRPSYRLSRGFTLIELLVAIVAGLFVAIAAFALSKQGSRFFHQETRLANAQFETLVGFERLRADIARAGYLSTPNIQAEPFHCRSPNIGSWPYGLSALGAMRIEAGPVYTQSTTNGLSPDRIFLTGSYTTDELFPVRAIQPGAGAGDEIFLNRTFGPMERLLRRYSGVGVDPSDVLNDTFRNGRAVRILDQAGTISFGVIAAANLDGENPRIVLQQSTTLPFITEGSSCGVAGHETGAQLSVLNWIRYQLEPLDAEGFPGDDTALQLVRHELSFLSASADNPDFIGPPEPVADFAVDLKFGLTHVTAGSSPLNPALTTLPVGDPLIPTIAREVTTAGGVRGPEHIRSVRARLSIRSREADRQVALDPASGNVLFRYQIAEDSFARVRTMGADIQLPNLAEVAW